MQCDLNNAMRRATNFAIGVLLLCAVAIPADADTITVTNTNDSGAGSFRQALADANDGDTIDFAVTGVIGVTSGLLMVNNSIIISGPGADNLALVGNAKSGILFINSGVTVTISGLTITNGHAGSNGGGIYNGSATVTLNDCVVTANSAQYGGGVYNEAVIGDTALTITNSTIEGNSASKEGGGIYEIGVIAPVTVTVNNSTLSGNSAFLGAGIRNVTAGMTATLMISNSSISGNSADNGDGGGISNQGGNATVEILNSTFSGNSAGFDGGSIHNTGKATIDLTDTILEAGDSGGNIVNNGGSVTSHGYNLSSDEAGGYLTGPGDQINTDPMQGPLQNNGGPTFTHALLPGSPAIDAGDPNFTPPPFYDQRGPGFDRVVNGRIDSGCFEVQTQTAAIELQASGRKVGGIDTSRLTWSGATSNNIDVYRDGVVIATVPNTGTYTDSTGTTGRARFTYKVCEAGSQTCSNEVTLRFR